MMIKSEQTMKNSVKFISTLCLAVILTACQGIGIGIGGGSVSVLAGANVSSH